MLELIDSQVRALRKRQLIDAYEADEQDANHRTGTYWGIRTNIADYGLADALDCPHDRTSDAHGDSDAAEAAWTKPCRSS